MGHKGLSKVQLGRESTAGTAVPATFIWRGPFSSLVDARATELVPENVGVALPSSRSFAANLMSEWSQPVTPLTPEQALHIFEAGIKSVGTGVADGDSSGYIYEYPFGTTSLNTVKTYSIQTGDEEQAELSDYCFVKSFTITGTAKQTLQISSEWAGRTVADGSFTGALSAEAVSQIHASAGQIFIDDNDGSFGGSAVAAGNLLEFTLSVTTGQEALFTIDSGQLYFNGIYFNSDAFSAELEMKFIASTATIAERTKWRNNEQRLVRLSFTGKDYGTPGTTGDFTKSAFQVDFPGAYTEFSGIEHEAGKSVFSAKLAGGYDTVSQDVLTLLVANEKATL